MPTRRDEWGKKIPTKQQPSKSGKQQTQDFLATETVENIKQFRQGPTDFQTSSTSVEHYETTDDKSSTIKDSKISTDSRVFSNTQRYTIIDGISESTTNIVKDSKTFVDSTNITESYTIVDGKRVPLEDKPGKSPDVLPAAGVPSRRDKKQPTSTVERLTETDVRDSKTSIVRDSKTFVDITDIIDVEEYTTINGERVPAGQKLVGKRPGEVSTDTTTTNYFESIIDIKDSKTKELKTFIDTEYIIVGGKRVPRKPEDKTPKKPQRKSPDELPAAGVPSRKDKKLTKRDESPSKKKKGPEDYPAAGKPTRTDKKPIPAPLVTDSKTTVESYESVTNISDSKTTVVKDSQTFVDNQSSVEHYTVTDSYDSSKPKGPKPIEDKPGKKRPKGPTEDVTTVENYEIINNVTDVKSSVSEDITSKTVVDKKTIVEDYTDTIDRVNKTFVKEDIIDIKDINEVENITNIKRVSDNKVIKIEKIIREPEPERPHYKPSLKEQCICELCTCGSGVTTR
ncbi:hypothetical protein NQ315_009811 [Exocentrus adspersus]|uniref:Uncharacterized protein n=1 Tax=Exocentrus adspersus TaxID=1586481 RepID=A0AAV8WHG4_9CUCU|nr:hypothetical protein NQ315_009811 [Exocentrus adspersus]